MSTTVPKEYARPIALTLNPGGLAEQRHEQLARRAHELENERARARRRELAPLRAKHARRARDADVSVRHVRLDVARESEHEHSRDHRAHGARDERGRIAGEPRDRAARGRAYQRAAALEPRHRGDRAAELVPGTNVRKV